MQKLLDEQRLELTILRTSENTTFTEDRLCIVLENLCEIIQQIITEKYHGVLSDEEHDKLINEIDPLGQG